MDVYTFGGNAIICSNAEVTKEYFYNFFQKKLSSNKPCFLKKTTFWTFTGIHGMPDGKCGNPAPKGMDEHKTTIDKIKSDFKDIISTMEYKFKNPKYIGNSRGITGIDEASKEEIDDVLKLFKDENCANVLILPDNERMFSAKSSKQKLL